MFVRLSSIVLLFASLAVYSPRVAKGDLLVEVTAGPKTDQVVWTFSGESTASGFGFFTDSGVILESEPVGIWGGFDNFTSVAAPARSEDGANILNIVSGSATLTHDAAGTITMANIVQAYFDDGDSGGDNLERFGFGIDAGVEFLENDVVSIDGSLVFSGASISEFNAGGIPYFSSSSAFGSEGNNLPLNLSIGTETIPEPNSVCLLGLIVVGGILRRRSRTVSTERGIGS